MESKKKRHASQASSDSVTTKKSKNDGGNTIDVSSEPDIAAENKLASSLLDKMFSSGDSASSAKTVSTSGGSTQIKKTVVISQNWKKIKESIPKPETKKPFKSRFANKNKHAQAAHNTNEDDEGSENKEEPKQLIPLGSNMTVTKTLAIDCEMVGVGEGGKEHCLARVSIVNTLGNCVYDKFVLPTEKVVDYRTRVSGIRPEDLVPGRAESFKVVQAEVAALLKDKVLVGHAIKNDLSTLVLTHPRHMIRDTSRYKPLLRHTGKPRALRYLTQDLLGVKIQSGEHSSVEDARATMLIYLKFRKDWEASFEKLNLRLKRKSKTHKMMKKKRKALESADPEISMKSIDD